MADLYRAQVACRVGAITPRTLDYWVTTALITPHSVYRGPGQLRDFFLFSFRELVQIRVVSALREAGLSLRRIRSALEALEARSGSDWQRAWLVTDAKRAYLVLDPATLETVGGDTSGQLAFAAVAMSKTHDEVSARLSRS